MAFPRYLKIDSNLSLDMGWWRVGKAPNSISEVRFAFGVGGQSALDWKGEKPNVNVGSLLVLHEHYVDEKDDQGERNHRQVLAQAVLAVECEPQLSDGFT